MTPSNANTSGLESAGHIVWLKAGGVSYYPEGEAFTISESCRVEPLVTAASAQARIAELEAEVAQANANGASHWSRATAAEARTDRLAQGMPDLSSVIGWLANGCDPTHAVTELRILQARTNHALQQEG